MIQKLVAAICLFTVVSIAAQGQNANRRIDSLLRSYHRKGQFDGSILVGSNGKILINRQYGLANRQFSVPICSSTRFPVASITKLYTAILILQFQEEHKLNLDTPVCSYLSGTLPLSSPKITIRQLLLHTSGLPREKVSAYRTVSNIKEFITRNIKDTLLTTPGSKYEYNNVNYILLGAVIEDITHKSWQNVLFEKIIEPLALKIQGL